MAKTSLNVTKYFRGNYESQKNFLHNCREWYFDVVLLDDMYDCTERRRAYRMTYHDDPYWLFQGRNYKGLELLHVQYARGVHNGWLACSYPEFENYIFGRQEKREPFRYGPVRYRRGWRGPYRVGTKYQKKESHTPKEPNVKALWREHKKFKKDKNKYAHWDTCSRCKQDAKKQQNRRRRRKDRSLLRSGQEERIGQYTWKADRWMWD